MQRSQIDTVFYNKCISILCLCELVRGAPKMQLEQMVMGNPTLIQIFMEALQLMQNDIIMDSLKALTRIIITWPSDTQIWNLMH